MQPIAPLSCRPLSRLLPLAALAALFALGNTAYGQARWSAESGVVLVGKVVDGPGVCPRRAQRGRGLGQCANREADHQWNTYTP